MVILRMRQSDGTTQRLSFDKLEISLGRDSDVNDIVIAEPSVSKKHALLSSSPQGVLVTDLGSTNGTMINGKRIDGSMALRPRDELAIGTARLWLDPEMRGGPARTYDLDAEADSASGASAPRLDSALRDPPARVGEPAGQPGSSAVRDGSALLPVLHDDEVHHTLATSVTSSLAGRRAKVDPMTANARIEITEGLALLIDRVVKATNIEAFSKAAPPNADAVKQLEAIIRAQVKSITSISEDVADQIAEAARREFAETGPIGGWLADPEITQIQCLRYDDIELTRNGRIADAELSFSSEAALHRAVVRLARQSGTECAPGEIVVERRMPDGGRMLALLPPMASSLCLSIRKHESVLRTLSELVSGDGLSEAMSEFLARCMRSRTNIVICGDDERSVLELAAALGSAAPELHRIAVLHSGGEVRVANRRTTGFSLPVSISDEEAAVRAATSLDFEHTFITSPKASVAANAVTAITGGGAGVVVAVRARTLPRALTSIVGELVLGRPGLPHEAAANLVAHAVEIGIEVEGSADLAPRIVRIAEIDPPSSGAAGCVLRDLFVHTAGPTMRPAAEASGEA
jgi:pilus assembly protein CpaF